MGIMSSTFRIPLQEMVSTTPTENTFRSPLHQMVSTTPTELWNDSCAVGELRYAIEHGAVGATSNPTIVFSVLKQEFADWKGRIHELFKVHPTFTEAELTWKLIDEMAVRGAE